MASVRRFTPQFNQHAPGVVTGYSEAGKPTWQTKDGAVQLWLGDCLDVLPTLNGVDAVVTDPPYGIDFGNGGGFSASHGWGPWRENVEWDKERPPKEIFDAILRLSVPTCIWGGNYFTDYLPPSSKWLIWDKGQTDFSLADVEVAWCSWGGAMRRLLYPLARALKDGKVHPTQKPLDVMVWNIEHLPPSCGPTVLDCFGGVFTTALACIRMGKRFIGIEREKKYFEDGITRIEAELSRNPLFEPKPQVQRELLE